MVKGANDMSNFYEYDEELRKELIAYLEENDMTHAEFARKVGCSETSINRFISKKYKMGRLVKRAISKGLGIDGDKEDSLYHINSLTCDDRYTVTLLVLDGEIHRLKNELELRKEKLYKLEWKRDQLHELLKGL